MSLIQNFRESESPVTEGFSSTEQGEEEESGLRSPSVPPKRRVLDRYYGKTEKDHKVFNASLFV
jgi:hypothetical protein